MVTRAEEFFFSDEIDHCERLVSIFEYISCLGVGNSAAVTQDWDRLSLKDDELFSCLEKGIYYRGMIELKQNQSLLTSMQAIAQKFGEMRERVELIHVPVEISRGTVLECNQACRKIIRRLEKLSVAFAVCLHTVIRVHDEYVAISIKPNLSDDSACHLTVVHIDEAITLYQDGSSECEELLNNLLVEETNECQHRLRHYGDEYKPDSHPARVSIDNARRYANGIGNPHLRAPKPVNMDITVLVDLTGFNATDEGVIEAENALAACKAATLDIRKAEKGATIQSMRAMVADLEEVIRLKKINQAQPSRQTQTQMEDSEGYTESEIRREVVAAPWDYGNLDDRPADTSLSDYEGRSIDDETEAVVAAPWDYGDVRANTGSPLTHSPGRTLMRERNYGNSFEHIRGTVSPPRSPYRYGDSDREEAEKEQNTPQGRRRQAKASIQLHSNVLDHIPSTAERWNSNSLVAPNSPKSPMRDSPSVSISPQQNPADCTQRAPDHLSGDDWGDAWVNERSLNLNSRLDAINIVEGEEYKDNNREEGLEEGISGSREDGTIVENMPLRHTGARAEPAFLSPERELPPAVGSNQPQYSYSIAEIGETLDAYTLGGSPEREEGENVNDEIHDGGLLEPVAEFQEGLPVSEAVLTLSPARSDSNLSVPGPSLVRTSSSRHSISITQAGQRALVSESSPGREDVVRISMDGRQEEVRVSHSSLYVPADAALVDDEEEDEILQSEVESARARVAVREEVALRMSVEEQRRTIALYSPDRRREAPLAAAASVRENQIHVDHQRDSVWRFDTDEVSLPSSESMGPGQPSRRGEDIHVARKSLENSFEETSLPFESGRLTGSVRSSRETSSALTGDGCEESHTRANSTDDTQSKDIEEGIEVLDIDELPFSEISHASTNALSLRTGPIRGPTPAAVSPARRASNPGLDPGPAPFIKSSASLLPSTSSSPQSSLALHKQPVQSLERETREVKKDTKLSSNEILLRESDARLALHHILRASTDSISSADTKGIDGSVSGSVDIETLSKQAYFAIREAVLSDLLRESSDSALPVEGVSTSVSTSVDSNVAFKRASVPTSPQPLHPESSGVPHVLNSEEEKKNEKLASMDNTRSSPVRRATNSSTPSAPHSPKRKLSSKNGAPSSRLQRARALYAAQQRAAAASKSPSKRKNATKIHQKAEEKKKLMSLHDTVPAIAASAIAAVTFRALAGVVSQPSPVACEIPPTPPPAVGSPSTELPAMSPRRMSSPSLSSSKRSPNALKEASTPPSTGALEADGRTAVRSNSVVDSSEWSEASHSSILFDSPPRPPPVPITERGASLRYSEVFGEGPVGIADAMTSGEDHSRIYEVKFEEEGSKQGHNRENNEEIHNERSKNAIISRHTQTKRLDENAHDDMPPEPEPQIAPPKPPIDYESVHASYSDLYFDSTVSNNNTIGGIMDKTGLDDARLMESTSSFGSSILPSNSQNTSPKRQEALADIVSDMERVISDTNTINSGGGLRKSQEVRRAINIIDEAVRAEQQREMRDILQLRTVFTNDALEESLLDDISIDMGTSKPITDENQREEHQHAPGSLDLSASLSVTSASAPPVASGRPSTAESHASTQGWTARVSLEKTETDEFARLENAIVAGEAGPDLQINDGEEGSIESGSMNSPPFRSLQNNQSQQREMDTFETEKADREAFRLARGQVEVRERRRIEALAARRQSRAKALLDRIDASPTVNITTETSFTPVASAAVDIKPPTESNHRKTTLGAWGKTNKSEASEPSSAPNIPSSRSRIMRNTSMQRKGEEFRVRGGGEAFEVDFATSSPPPQKRPSEEHNVPSKASKVSKEKSDDSDEVREERKRRVVAQAEAREAARKQKWSSNRKSDTNVDHMEYPLDGSGRPLLPVTAAGGIAIGSNVKDDASLHGSGTRVETDEMQAHIASLPDAQPTRTFQAASSSVKARSERALRSRLSNVSRVKNALSNVCLAGPSNQEARERCFAALDHWHSGQGAEKRRRRLASMALATGAAQGSTGTDTNTVPISSAVSQFVVLLFHSKTLSFRGLYAVDPITTSLYRIHGRGPMELPTDKISGFLKYETGNRSFVPLTHVKNLTSTCDAVSVEPSSLKKGFM